MGSGTAAWPSWVTACVNSCNPSSLSKRSLFNVPWIVAPESPAAAPRLAVRRLSATSRCVSWRAVAGWKAGRWSGRGRVRAGGRRSGLVRAAKVAGVPGASAALVSVLRACERSPVRTGLLL